MARQPRRQPRPAGSGGGTFKTLFRYELKVLLRDKRMVFFSILLPLIILPLFIFIMRIAERQAEERRESRTYEYAVAGDNAELARSLLTAALSLPAQAPPAAETGPDADTAPRVRLEEVTVEDPDSALKAGDVDVVVRALTTEEVRARRDSIRAAAEAAEPGRDAEDLAEAAVAEALGEDEPVVPLIELRMEGDEERSQSAASQLRDRLEALREYRRNQVYREAGLPVDPASVAAVEVTGVATAERESGAQLALWLTPVLVMLMLSGGSVVAADTISGEKERGTLETLLTTSARRSDIVLAKQALIITVGIAITVINLANLGLYLGLGLFELPDRFTLSVAPLGLLLLLLLFLPLTVLISSVLLLLSGYTKSYKEYQLYFFPVLLVFLLPSAAAALPGLELASVISVVPLANISVAVREILVGDYAWPYLALTILTTAGLAAWLARLTERSLSTEKLITAAEMDEADLRGGPALFPKRVLRWFAAMWAIFFVSSTYLGAELGLRGQILFNLVFLFLGASLLMIRRYRLDPREALALRLPHPAVWLAVLVGAPSAFVVGVGLAGLGQQIFPIPQEALEAFGQFLLPEELPLWQVVFFLAILPGVCEEIAFRGVLLHGLRKRFGPILLAVVTGLIFGFFHVELFRLIPTTYLGIIMGGVTILTGSIFPAMLWHALNNATALVPSYLGWWAPDATLPTWAYLAGALGLGLAFWLIWANRTPYPGLVVRRPARHRRGVFE